LKYQRQCIEKGEQSLAGWAEEAANEVTDPLICGSAGPAMDGRVSTRAPTARAKDAHAILHLLRNPIIAHYRSWITQPAAFPLDDEAPQRVAGVRNQRPARFVRSSPVAVVLV
jgi:hypothetical protein